MAIPMGITGINEVVVDGKTVDSKYYSVNGTTVTLKKEFVETLTAGEHTLVVKNGSESTTATFKVQTGATVVTSAGTGDMGLALYGALAISSVLGMGWIGKKKHD